MPEDERYERAMQAVRQMLQRVDCPLWAIAPECLSTLVYAVLDAMWAVERRLPSACVIGSDHAPDDTDRGQPRQRGR